VENTYACPGRKAPSATPARVAYIRQIKRLTPNPNNMGQRHQAFIIARVVPHGGTKHQYRCIAAFHHQWCYGKLPLQATRRLLTLVKQKDNADIIRAEIRSINGKYGSLGNKPDVPDVPCPYVALLLATCWSTDLAVDSLYASSSNPSSPPHSTHK
jgi:hypothetical protein